MSPRTGRPTDNPKSNQYRIRMSDNELDMLEYCAKQTGLSKADVIRKGLQDLYSKLKEKE